MFDRLPDREPTAYEDDWTDLPASGPMPKWLGGVLAPLLLAAYGLTCCVTRVGVVSDRSGSMRLEGTQAVALGLASLSLGLFLHFHYFWGNVFHLAAWAVLGKIASLIALIGSLGYLIIHIGVLGR